MKLKQFLKPTKMKIITTIILIVLIALILAAILRTPMPFVISESNSMSPVINRGDLLAVQAVPTSQLGVGDIILYSVWNNRLVVSRIKSINPDGSFQTKGDANLGQMEFEKEIESTQIIGKVIFVLPSVGWLDLFYVGWIIRIFLIYLISCIIIQIFQRSKA